MITVRDCLLYLEQQGWSDLIDSRWEKDVIEELTNKFPDVSDDILKEVLLVVLV